MNPDPVCIAWGAAVSWLTDLLKYTPLGAVRPDGRRVIDPKFVAAVLSIVGHYLHGLMIGGAPWGTVLWCAVSTFGIAVGTHEVDRKIGDVLAPGPQTRR